jgi:hypothetical protein
MPHGHHHHPNHQPHYGTIYHAAKHLSHPPRPGGGRPWICVALLVTLTVVFIISVSLAFDHHYNHHSFWLSSMVIQPTKYSKINDLVFMGDKALNLLTQSTSFAVRNLRGPYQHAVALFPHST